MSRIPIIPPEAGKALLVMQKHFAESLVAAYLHGSAVTGGLRPDSDVDLLAVIDRAMTSEDRVLLANDLMMISGYSHDNTALRPVELIIFLPAALTATSYPACCEFIYGEWLRSQFESGKTPEPVCDPELTLVLAQARQASLSLIGPDANELLPVIPQADIRRAVKDILPMLLH